MSDFDDCLKVVFDKLLPQAEDLAAGSDRTIKACLMTLLQPYAKEYMFPASRAALLDNREHMWNVQLRFWDINEGVDRATDMDYTEPELVRGFDGVQEYITDWVEAVHEKSGEDLTAIPEFKPGALKKRLGGMRPAISRSGGSAGSSIRYQVGEWWYMAQLEISREDVPLTDIKE